MLSLELVFVLVGVGHLFAALGASVLAGISRMACRELGESGMAGEERIPGKGTAGAVTNGL